MLTGQSLEQFSASLASGTPTPGGGSAAALAGSLGAALVQMVCALSVGREACRPHEAALGRAAERAQALRGELLGLIDRDAAAYDGFLRAVRLPKGSDTEKAARKMAMQGATLVATKTPLATAAAAVAVLGLAHEVAGMGNRNAISDAGTAAALAHAALMSAGMNVRINLGGLGDPASAAGIEERLRGLETEGLRLRDACFAAVTAAIGTR